MRDARRQPARRRPVFLVKLRYANHNYFNRTLSRLGQDDTEFNAPMGPDCARKKRLRPRPQQAWIDRVAGAFFDLTLDGGPRPRWMRARHPAPQRLYGEDVVIDRLFP